MFEKLKKFKWGYIIIALVLAVIGVCFIAMQDALKHLAITIGVILSVFAIVFAVLTIADKNRGASFAFKIFFSVMVLISGIVTAVFNEGAIEIIISVFSLLLIIDSSFKLHTSAMSKRYDVVGWWMIMVFSVLSIATAFFLLKFTPQNHVACSIILGINLIINAIGNFLSAFFITGFERNMEDEVYYERRAREREIEEKCKRRFEKDEAKRAKRAKKNSAPELQELDTVYEFTAENEEADEDA